MRYDPVHNKSQRDTYMSFLGQCGDVAKATAQYAAYIADLDAQAAGAPAVTATRNAMPTCHQCGAPGDGVSCGCAAE
jgi:hypothetical protein